ncbi:hypothetical protein OG568_52675 (plasmid) [Streptomyces sp. NBC_01450]|uniref:hypothetical protein n=1 Tax=Streptomyces sp. NBC_01450 TaxID=2903871 RepID=UPI002E3340D8|nr:hypothetical protein [Streptomyces sp. NBC_01450]
MEQVGHRRAIDPFVAVVPSRQRHSFAGGLDAANDPGEDGDQVRIGGDDALAVGLGWADLQQRHRLAGRCLVLAKTQVSELQKFLDPGPGASQDLDTRPGPERVVLLAFGIEPRPRLVDRGEEQHGGTPAAAVPAGASIL